MENVKVTQHDKKRYCSKCNEILEVGYIQGYCRTCKSEYNKRYGVENREYIREYSKQYRESNTQEHYLYELKASDTESLYTGSTCYKDRVCNKHLKGHSHLELDVRDWQELELERVQYIDVTDFIDTSDNDIARAEREYLESLLIQDLQSLLNTCMLNMTSIDFNLSVDRIEHLNDMYRNYIQDSQEWQILEVKEVITPSKSITYNFKDLKFK